MAVGWGKERGERSAFLSSRTLVSHKSTPFSSFQFFNLQISSITRVSSFLLSSLNRFCYLVFNQAPNKLLLFFEKAFGNEISDTVQEARELEISRSKSVVGGAGLLKDVASWTNSSFLCVRCWEQLMLINSMAKRSLGILALWPEGGVLLPCAFTLWKVIV